MCSRAWRIASRASCTRGCGGICGGAAAGGFAGAATAAAGAAGPADAAVKPNVISSVAVINRIKNTNRFIPFPPRPNSGADGASQINAYGPAAPRFAATPAQYKSGPPIRPVSKLILMKEAKTFCKGVACYASRIVQRRIHRPLMRASLPLRFSTTKPKPPLQPRFPAPGQNAS